MHRAQALAVEEVEAGACCCAALEARWELEGVGMGEVRGLEESLALQGAQNILEEEAHRAGNLVQGRILRAAEVHILYQTDQEGSNHQKMDVEGIREERMAHRGACQEEEEEDRVGMHSRMSLEISRVARPHVSS